ncbi:IS66 family insertion sequence element accessory protein TnpA [Paenibacillus harenae]|uniref:IS66 family insertion sequence element accessory protein TnpA n=1 Tax=Paenibacillus harenae TaxID=306543 RepID=UPI000492BD53|nr:hypothetical protein [Paenibacillus harenae]
MGREEIRVKWEARIQAFRASGEKATQWCKANQINRRQLYAWIKRLDAAPSSPRVKPATFLPVQVTSDAKSESSSSLRIRIGSAVIEVEPGFEPALLRKVVYALEQVPSC